MPAKGYTDPAALPSRIVTWLRQNPGQHRTRDVAAGLPAPDGMKPKVWTQKVGNALGRLARDGDVVREHIDIGHRHPVGHYSARED